MPVSELRQYHFCPRVVYYHVLGVREADKEYMRSGKERQLDLWSKERRRATLAGLRKLKVDERVYGLPLSSRRLCLVGTLDMAVRVGKEWLVVEVKSGRRPRTPLLGHRVQGAAYSMLLEERFGIVTRRFLLLYEDGYIEVQMTQQLRNHVRWTVRQIIRIMNGWIPPVVPKRRCSSCGYSMLCPV